MLGRAAEQSKKYRLMSTAQDSQEGIIETAQEFLGTFFGFLQGEYLALYVLLTLYLIYLGPMDPSKGS